VNAFGEKTIFSPQTPLFRFLTVSCLTKPLVYPLTRITVKNLSFAIKLNYLILCFCSRARNFLPSAAAYSSLRGKLGKPETFTRRNSLPTYAKKFLIVRSTKILKSYTMFQINGYEVCFERGVRSPKRAGFALLKLISESKGEHRVKFFHAGEKRTSPRESKPKSAAKYRKEHERKKVTGSFKSCTAKFRARNKFLKQ